MSVPVMSPAELLDELVEAAKAFATCPNPPDAQTMDEWMAQSRWRDAKDRLRAARTAVETLIPGSDALLTAARKVAAAPLPPLTEAGATLQYEVLGLRGARPARCPRPHGDPPMTILEPLRRAGVALGLLRPNMTDVERAATATFRAQAMGDYEAASAARERHARLLERATRK